MTYTLATHEEVTLEKQKRASGFAQGKSKSVTVLSLTKEGKKALADEVLLAITAHEDLTPHSTAEQIIEALVNEDSFIDAIMMCHRIQQDADPISQGDLPNSYIGSIISDPVFALNDQEWDPYVLNIALLEAAIRVEKEQFNLTHPASENAFFR